MDTSNQNKVALANAQTLNKNLNSYLASFDKNANKGWTDVANWLQKIENLLIKFPNPNIEDKSTFAKRLAQCLNPLLNYGVHQVALRVYELVFKNMILLDVEGKGDVYKRVFSENMSLYSLGLFPFFHYASTLVKPKILDIINDYYIPLGIHLIPCLPGLVLSILPGLEEQNEELQKKVWSTLDKAGDESGKNYLIGAIWMAILRSPKVRNAGLKYLNKRIPSSNVEEESASDDSDFSDDEEAEAKEQDFEEQQNPEEEVVEQKNIVDEEENENVETIQNSTNPTVKEYALFEKMQNEFLIELENKLKEIDDNQIFFPNKNTLVVNALITCLEDDNKLVCRNALEFMITHLPLSTSILGNDKKYILTEAVLRILPRKDQSLSRKVHTWLFGRPNLDNKFLITEKNEFVLAYVIKAIISIFSTEPKSISQSTIPIRVIQFFFNEHEHMVEKILGETSLSILRYIFKYKEGQAFSQELLRSGERFMESIPSHFQVLLNSLSNELDSEIKQKRDKKCFEIINLVDFTYEKIMNREERTFSNKVFISFLHAILSGILKSLASLQEDDFIKSTFAVPALILTLKLLEKNEKENIQSDNPDSLQGFSEFSFSFIKILNLVKDEEANLTDSSKINSLFAAGSKIIIKLIKLNPKETGNAEEWISTLSYLIQSNDPFKSLTTIESVTELLLLSSNPKIAKLCCDNLWHLLDYSNFQTKIVEMLIRMQNLSQHIFNDSLASSFQSIEITEKEAAIRRFSNFWKLTHEMKLEHTPSGLYIMLDFLDHENPLIRHASKSWLNESIPILSRILDPIYDALLQEIDLWYITPGNQIFYTKPYDTRRTVEAFKKLKSILIASSELFIRYISNVEISSKFNVKLQERDESGGSYLDILIKFCLRYVQGQAIESLGMRFHSENAMVNASSCEFLEILLGYLENKSLSYNITTTITEPILRVLKSSIENKDFVLQVQLLNLLRVLLFQATFSEPKNSNTNVPLITSPIFLPNLLTGIHSPSPYVRVQFIKFIVSCLPLLSNLFPKNLLPEAIFSILRTSFDVLRGLNFDGIDYDEYNLEDNKQEIHSESSHHNRVEMISVFEGIKNVLEYFLALDEVQEHQNPAIQNTSFFTVKNLVTFGLASVLAAKKFDPLGMKTPTYPSTETMNFLLSNLKSIILVFGKCWKNSTNFQNFANITNFGTIPYTFEVFSGYNKKLQDQLKIDYIGSRSIKVGIMI